MKRPPATASSIDGSQLVPYHCHGLPVVEPECSGKRRRSNMEAGRKNVLYPVKWCTELRGDHARGNQPWCWFRRFHGAALAQGERTSVFTYSRAHGQQARSTSFGRRNALSALTRPRRSSRAACILAVASSFPGRPAGLGRSPLPAQRSGDRVGKPRLPRCCRCRLPASRPKE